MSARVQILAALITLLTFLPLLFNWGAFLKLPWKRAILELEDISTSY